MCVIKAGAVRRCPSPRDISKSQDIYGYTIPACLSYRTLWPVSSFETCDILHPDFLTLPIFPSLNLPFPLFLCLNNDHIPKEG